MKTFKEHDHYYFYLLLFQGSNHFKIGVTSGLSHSRLRVHIRKISINPKESFLVFGDEREVSDLEWFIKTEFSEYNRAEEVKAIYGPFDGYTEVLSQDCLEQVRAAIEKWQQNTWCSLSLSQGLSLKNIYTDNNIDQTNFKDEVKRAQPLVLTDLYQPLQTILKSPSVTRVNYGYNKKVSYFGLQFLIEAEEGFQHDLFDSQFTDRETFHYGSLEFQHLFCSGQKLRSGGTYLRGSIDLVRIPEMIQTDFRQADIAAMNAFFESLANHNKRDVNFKIKCQYSVRNKFIANFLPYGIGHQVIIGKTLDGPDAQLW